MTFTQACENLSSKGFIETLELIPISNPIPPAWNLNEYCHYHKKFGHKTDNCFRLKHEIQYLIDNETLSNPNIITKPNIRKSPLLDYHRAPPSYQNWVQLDEIEWDFLRLIGTTNININAVEVQGIQDEEDELLKEAIAIWGILPKGVAELKKRVLEKNVANITRSGKHYKPSFLEKDHLDKDLREGSKPTESRGTKEEEEEEEEEEEDRILMQLKKTQAHMSL